MAEHAKQTESGLIFAVDLNRNGGGTALSWKEIGAPQQANHVRWIHLDYTHRKAREWLLNESGIAGPIVDAMLHEDIRPRSLQTQHGILAVLRGVNLNPGSDVEDMVSIRVWLEKDRIISARHRRLMSVVQIRDEVEQGDGPVSAGDLITRLVDNLNDRIADVIENLDENIEAAEASQARNLQQNYRGEFGNLRRKTAHIRRYLSPQREALDRLSRMRGAILSNSELARLQEETNRLTLFVEELDLSRERAMVAQEDLLSSLALEQNSKMYLLSIVAAVFLPLSFLTGLMGMNVAGLPGTENPWSFAVLVLLMLSIGAGIMLLFRWKKWL